jgi:hypothetical protein
MTATQISWSLGSCRNKSLNHVETTVSPHAASDQNFFSYLRKVHTFFRRSPTLSTAHLPPTFARYATLSRNNFDPIICGTISPSTQTNKNTLRALWKNRRILRETPSDSLQPPNPQISKTAQTVAHYSAMPRNLVRSCPIPLFPNTFDRSFFARPGLPVTASVVAIQQSPP